MDKRESGALVVLAVGLSVVGFGCVLTYGVLREYGDVCGETPALEQVWLGGAGLGPVVAVVAVVLAIVVATMARRRGTRMAAAVLVVVGVVGATASGAAGVAGKKAAWAANPATYGSCGGYNSSL
jgi:putative copper export protein